MYSWRHEPEEAERVGFEPTRGFPLRALQARLIGHSSTSPQIATGGCSPRGFPAVALAAPSPGHTRQHRPIIPYLRAGRQTRGVPRATIEGLPPETAPSAHQGRQRGAKRRGWDSNPRSLIGTPLFESGTINHSDTSPHTHTPQKRGLPPPCLLTHKRALPRRQCYYTWRTPAFQTAPSLHRGTGHSSHASSTLSATSSIEQLLAHPAGGCPKAYQALHPLGDLLRPVKAVALSLSPDCRPQGVHSSPHTPILPYRCTGSNCSPPPVPPRDQGLSPTPSWCRGGRFW